MSNPSGHPQFITITVYEWKHLLKPDKYKRIILDSLSFLAKEKRVLIYGFVIMSNHMHIIWQALGPFVITDVQRDFLKFVAQQIRFDLLDNHPKALQHFEVKSRDRKYQFWKRNSLSVDLFTKAVFDQKLDYIHNNPIEAKLCSVPEEYYYSSASYYLLNEVHFGFLTHHQGD